MKKTAIIFMAIMTLAMAASGKVMRRTLGIFPVSYTHLPLPTNSLV